MNLFIDLHIHSGLSPCGDLDMTPNNVVNMAKIKGLDAIAITDHNTTGNLKAFSQVAERANLLFVPGIELCTREEVHLLGYFEGVEQALMFQQALEKHLPKEKNVEAIFGEQVHYDDQDQVIGKSDTLLIGSTDLAIEEAVALIRAYGGVAVPAHINREAYGILITLGFIDASLGFRTVEITGELPWEALVKQHPYLKDYKYIRSSDAHTLGDILEPISTLRVKEPTVKGIIEALRDGTGEKGHRRVGRN